MASDYKDNKEDIMLFRAGEFIVEADFGHALPLLEQVIASGDELQKEMAEAYLIQIQTMLDTDQADYVGGIGNDDEQDMLFDDSGSVDSDAVLADVTDSGVIDGLDELEPLALSDNVVLTDDDDVVSDIGMRKIETPLEATDNLLFDSEADEKVNEVTDTDIVLDDVSDSSVDVLFDTDEQESVELLFDDSDDGIVILEDDAQTADEQVPDVSEVIEKFDDKSDDKSAETLAETLIEKSSEKAHDTVGEAANEAEQPQQSEPQQETIQPTLAGDPEVAMAIEQAEMLIADNEYDTAELVLAPALVAENAEQRGHAESLLALIADAAQYDEVAETAEISASSSASPEIAEISATTSEDTSSDKQNEAFDQFMSPTTADIDSWLTEGAEKLAAGDTSAATALFERAMINGDNEQKAMATAYLDSLSETVVDKKNIADEFELSLDQAAELIADEEYEMAGLILEEVAEHGADTQREMAKAYLIEVKAMQAAQERDAQEKGTTVLSHVDKTDNVLLAPTLSDENTITEPRVSDSTLPEVLSDAEIVETTVETTAQAATAEPEVIGIDSDDDRNKDAFAEVRTMVGQFGSVAEHEDDSLIPEHFAVKATILANQTSQEKVQKSAIEKGAEKQSRTQVEEVATAEKQAEKQLEALADVDAEMIADTVSETTPETIAEVASETVSDVVSPTPSELVSDVISDSISETISDSISDTISDTDAEILFDTDTAGTASVAPIAPPVALVSVAAEKKQVADTLPVEEILSKESLMSPTQALSLGEGLSAEQVLSAQAQTTQQLFSRQGFHVGDVGLMIAYEDGSALVDLPDVYQLPAAPEWFVGVTNLHGNIIPVFDLDVYLGFGRQTRKKPMLLVLSHEENATGVIIDGLPQRLSWSKEQQTGKNIAPTEISAHVETACLIEKELWFDLDVESLCNALEHRLAA